ncbi:MAG: hypothetical protein S4CHLAM37_13770 [Chlamydiia bacterium]|nr:hypothetical protein [Chlamydiia bacterium]
MKKSYLALVGVALLALCSCNKSEKKHKKDVVTQRYIHKYGYDVSKDEWDANQFPGQVVTTLKNGVSIASTYEDGVLHGQTTYTYPHSQTLESLHLYEHGNLTKKISYDLKGIPQKEDTFLSPTHVKTKFWYKTGTPMCVEERVDNNLINGEYYSLQNEAESNVRDGMGTKTIRTQDGKLFAREVIEEGIVIGRESFHPNGSPHVVFAYRDGYIDGEKRVFGPTGDPVMLETYTKGKLDGLCTYFQNGYKYLESPFTLGRKEGIERQYIDGETLVEETEYHDGQKHGPSTFYSDGISKTEWYYNNELVSRTKFEELSEREKMISIMNERARPKAQPLADDHEDEFLEALEAESRDQ